MSQKWNNYHNSFGSSEKHPISPNNPLHSGPVIVLIISLIIFLIWIYTRDAYSMLKNNIALLVIIFFGIFLLIVYSLWKNGHTTWSWIITIIFLFLFFTGFLNFKSSIMDEQGNESTLSSKIFGI